MDFLQYDLGQLAAGQVVEVSLNIAANVRLLDSANLGLFRAGQSYRYFGEHVTQTPYRLTVPSTGQWHLVIDLGGAAGELRPDVKVFRPVG